MWCDECRRSRRGKRQKFHHGNLEVRVTGVPSQHDAKRLIRSFVDSCVCPTGKTGGTFSEITWLRSSNSSDGGKSSVVVVRGVGDALRFNPPNEPLAIVRK